MLGKSDDDVIERVREAQKRLRPTKIASDGTIMEWVGYNSTSSTLLGQLYCISLRVHIPYLFSIS